ncbi:type-4 ice-structuring protein LS-12-like isoform X1 [Poeciliopsis prolifica]|uniref:type-4 ice-structuring protein LS-12-like isoform X1 n=1 Tax=Poeciliopsis prolifica TaxID=188132 RepID=UPI0024131D32|nr:type-4 ice-structuring protein LS-12-like isoform X1 [Poeciliopsis prolifica]
MVINSSTIKASDILTEGTIKSRNPRSEGLCFSSAAMKFSLVATILVVLAVAHGSVARSLVKRELQPEVDRITQVLREMSTFVSTATQDMMEKMKAPEMTNTAQTYMEDSRAKIQPLVEQAAKLQEQIKPIISNIEEHIRPITDDFNGQVLTDNLQNQMKPLTDMMEKFLQKVMDQSKALLPPQ